MVDCIDTIVMSRNWIDNVFDVNGYKNKLSFR